MTRSTALVAALTLALLPFGLTVVGTSATGSTAVKRPLAFSQAKLFVEINSTDGDAGLQLDLDGQAWERAAIRAPNGHTILDVAGSGSLAGYGLTGLTFESSEPPFDVHSLPRFKTRFPAGVYLFYGETVDGRTITGRTRLTHAFPAGPVVTAPVENDAVSREDLTVRWKPVLKPAGIRIVTYQVIVTQQEPERELAVDLPPTARSFSVPADFLAPRAEYAVEVLAREQSGNQTITEVAFRTR